MEIISPQDRSPITSEKEMYLTKGVEDLPKAADMEEIPSNSSEEIAGVRSSQTARGSTCPPDQVP